MSCYRLFNVACSSSSRERLWQR